MFPLGEHTRGFLFLKGDFFSPGEQYRAKMFPNQQKSILVEHPEAILFP